MSIFNMVVGVHPNALIYLELIHLDMNQIPRFRDAYRQKENIIILTRTGGSNRADYLEENKKLQSHPQYVKDYDDSFDNTFAHFVFNILKDDMDIFKDIADDPNPMALFLEKLNNMPVNDSLN